MASEVWSPRVTSSSCITGTGLKKCIPTTCAGRRVAAASEVIDIELVFEARIASRGRSSSRRRNSSRFTATSSTTASTARSTRAQSSRPDAARTRDSAAARSGAPSFPFSTSFPRVTASFSTERRASSGVASARTTCIPAWAATWAIPLPIWPAPTTASVSIAIAVLLSGGHPAPRPGRGISLRPAGL